jgi:hypothetical protein
MELDGKLQASDKELRTKILKSKHPDEIISNFTTPLLDFIDTNIQFEYDEYLNLMGSKYSALNVLIISLVATVPVLILGSVGYATSPKTKKNLCFMLITLLLAIMCIISSLLTYKIHVMKQEHSLKMRSKFQMTLIKSHAIIQSSMMSTFMILSCIILLFKVIEGQCTKSALIAQWNCNPYAHARSLPPQWTLIIILIPLVFVALRGTPAIATFLCWLLGIATIITAGLITHNYSVLVQLFFYVIFSILFSYEFRRRNLIAFLSYFKYKCLLQSNEEHAEETHATEMRHMIGNVAHDMKTVSTINLFCLFFHFFFI